MRRLRLAFVLALVGFVLATTIETRDLQNGGSWAALSPPVSPFVKYEGPADPSLSSWYLIPICRVISVVGKDGRKELIYRGDVEFWSVDGQRMIYTLGSQIPTSRRYGLAEDVWLHCRGGSITQRVPAKFPKVPPRNLAESERGQKPNWHIWGDCQRVSEGKRVLVPPSMNGATGVGFPILEYHAGESRTSPILWKVDLRDWRLPDGSQLTCTAGQRPWTE